MAVIPSCPAQGTADIDTSIFLLNQMVARDNVIAEIRRNELEKLFDFLQLLTTEAATSTITATAERSATASAAQPQAQACLAEEQLSADVDAPSAAPPGLHPGFVVPEMTYGLENMQMPLGLETIDTTNGLSPDQMLSVAELLDWDSALAGADVHWLWANPPEMGAVPGDGAYPSNFPG